MFELLSLEHGIVDQPGRQGFYQKEGMLLIAPENGKIKGCEESSQVGNL